VSANPIKRSEVPQQVARAVAELMMANFDQQLLAVRRECKVLDCFAVLGAATSAQVAAKTGLPLDKCQRVLMDLSEGEIVSRQAMQFGRALHYVYTLVSISDCDF